jgi:putative endonuclease
MCKCYILFSASRNIYYTGFTTQSVEDRLEMHISGYYGPEKFTADLDDWKIFLIIACNSISEARKIESHIKRMKSKKYIENLKKHPEIIDRLKLMYSSDII